MIRVYSLITIILLLSGTAQAKNNLDPEIREKILNQGVAAASLDRMLDWMNEKKGTSSTQRVYSCKDKAEENLRPCRMRDRTYYFKDVKILSYRYLVSINFSQPSTEKRFYFIDLINGAVKTEYVTHGKGSGKGSIAENFSNTLNSKMTSLGTYLIGETYKGGHGLTLRLYGLDKTNDNAYDRDIVFHRAKYADESFFQKIDPKTKQKYSRLGLSSGCPAISPSAMQLYLPLLENGGLIDHHHDQLTP